MRAKAALLLACWAAPILAAAADARPPRKPRVAVMEIRPLGTEAVKAEVLSEVALTEAAAGSGLEVVGRSDINALLGLERQRQLLGCGEDTSCLAEIGGALGVDFLLTGSLGRLGTLYRLDLRLVDARKARVLGRVGESVTGDEEKLVGAVQRGVRQLLAPIVPAGAAVARAAAPAATVAPAATASRFDGPWHVVVSCPPAGSVKGYRLEFPAAVARGRIDGLSGTEGAPGSLHLTGPIGADGAATLTVDGVTADPSHAVKHVARGTRIRYHVTAQLDERSGTGKRVEHRACDFTFTRR